MVASEAAQAVAPLAGLQQQIQRVVLWIRPDGGQAKARRNAWAAMVADSQCRHSHRPIAGRAVQPATSVASAVSTAGAVNARRLAAASR